MSKGNTRNSATKKLTLPTKGTKSPVGYATLDRKSCQPFIDWCVSHTGEYTLDDAKSKGIFYRRQYHVAMYLLKNHKDHPHTQLVVDRVWEILDALLKRDLKPNKREEYIKRKANIEAAEAGTYQWETTKSKSKKSSTVSRRRSKAQAETQEASKAETPKTRRKKTETKTEAPPQGTVQKSNTLERILALLEAGKISEALAERMMDKAEAE